VSRTPETHDLLVELQGLLTQFPELVKHLHLPLHPALEENVSLTAFPFTLLVNECSDHGLADWAAQESGLESPPAIFRG
jgi:hypothetical protein